MNGFFPLTEPLIEGPATRVMRPARRHQEDVEIGPLGPVRAFNLTGMTARPSPRRSARPKTGPRAVALRDGRPESAPRGRQSWSAYTPLFPIRHPNRSSPNIGGQQFSVFKPALADLAVDRLAPVSAEMRRISEDRAFSLTRFCAMAASRAGAMAEATMKQVPRDRGLPRRLGAGRTTGLTACRIASAVADCAVGHGPLRSGKRSWISRRI